LNLRGEAKPEATDSVTPGGKAQGNRPRPFHAG
jgi:hypothetical protein